MDLTINSVGLSLSHHALIILSDRPSSLSQSQLMLNYDTQVTKDHVPQRQFNYMLHVISHRMRQHFELSYKKISQIINIENELKN